MIDFILCSLFWPLYYTLSAGEKALTTIKRLPRLLQYYLNLRWRRHHWKAQYLSLPRNIRCSELWDELAKAAAEHERVSR